MAAASYDQLLKQVEALKMENSNLRQELEDNSNHLTKLETEASNMKEVLKQLQGSIEDEAMASSGQIDLLERLKELNLDSSNFPGVKLRSKMSLRSYGSREGSVSSRSGECSPVPMGSFPRRGFVNGSRENTGYLEELEKERSLLLADLDKEEKEKDWYYAQLQNLTKRIDSLPLTENSMNFVCKDDKTRRFRIQLGVLLLDVLNYQRYSVEMFITICLFFELYYRTCARCCSIHGVTRIRTFLK
ncbi:hypothetical protein FD754_023457, partial [Muntiacus muntjak]